MSSEPMNYKKQHGLWCKYFMVCESEPDAPWGLLIMTSVREALTDRRRDVAVLVCFSHSLPHTIFWTLWGRGWCYCILSHVCDATLPSHRTHYEIRVVSFFLVCMFWIFHPSQKKHLCLNLRFMYLNCIYNFHKIHPYFKITF